PRPGCGGGRHQRRHQIAGEGRAQGRDHHHARPICDDEHRLFGSGLWPGRRDRADLPVDLRQFPEL
ncbi:hypothetical protein LTR94_038304, partial [Friedmanniomyces endolithicus]